MPEAQERATAVVDVLLMVNGVARPLPGLDAGATLVDVLRDELHLFGTKKGCNHGQCGSCTVLVEGRRVLSCLTLAVTAEGRAVATVEGVGTEQAPHPLQRAFVEHDGLQCGYCTPGQICSALAMLDEARAGDPSHVSDDLASTASRLPLSRDEIRERMSGNLCRCGAYVGIVDAVDQLQRSGVDGRTATDGHR